MFMLRRCNRSDPPGSDQRREHALARTTPITATPGHYQPADTIIAFLETSDSARARRCWRIASLSLARQS